MIRIERPNARKTGAVNDTSECRRAKIMLQTQEALALSYGIQGVLSSSLTGQY